MHFKCNVQLEEKKEMSRRGSQQILKRDLCCKLLGNSDSGLLRVRNSELVRPCGFVLSLQASPAVKL